jgi:hypothetical protein
VQGLGRVPGIGRSEPELTTSPGLRGGAAVIRDSIGDIARV